MSSCPGPDPRYPASNRRLSSVALHSPLYFTALHCIRDTDRSTALSDLKKSARKILKLRENILVSRELRGKNREPEITVLSTNLKEKKKIPRCEDVYVFSENKILSRILSILTFLSNFLNSNFYFDRINVIINYM